MRFLFLILVLGMFALCLFGVAVTIMQTNDVLTGIASLSWPATSGTITKWKIKVSYSGPTVSHAFLTCEYKYVVGGIEYSNDRVASYPLSENDIYGIGSSVTEGSSHSVFFDPANPRKSVLIKGWKPWMLMIGCAFFIGPFAIIIALYKSRNNIAELWKGWRWFSFPS